MQTHTFGNFTVEVLPWIMEGMSLGENTVRIFRDGNLVRTDTLKDRVELSSFLATVEKCGLSKWLEAMSKKESVSCIECIEIHVERRVCLGGHLNIIPTAQNIAIKCSAANTYLLLKAFTIQHPKLSITVIVPIV